jgi:hypothetical protein
MSRMVYIKEAPLAGMMLSHLKAPQLMHAPVMRHMDVRLEKVCFTDAFTTRGHASWSAHCGGRVIPMYAGLKWRRKEVKYEVYIVKDRKVSLISIDT